MDTAANSSTYQIAALVADKMKSQVAVLVGVDSLGNVSLWSHPDLSNLKVANTFQSLADKKYADAAKAGETC